MSTLKRQKADGTWEFVTTENEALLQLAGVGRTTETVKNTSDKIGVLSSLTTPVKTDLVSALNSHSADNSKQIPHLGTTTNSTNAYSVTTTETILTNQKFTVKINAASTGTATLNISSIGSAKGIKKTGGLDATLKIGVYTFFYDGTNFQLLGEGGDYGTATSAEVLTGSTIGTDVGIVSGTAVSISPLAGSNQIVYDNSNVVNNGNVWFNGTQSPAKGHNNSVPSHRYTMLYTGSIRFAFNLYSQYSNNTVYGKVYKNGVAYGTLRTNTTGSAMLFTEDLSCNANDYLEVYLWSQTGSSLAINELVTIAVLNPQIQIS